MTPPRLVTPRLVLARTALTALAIALVPQGIWSALITFNLKTTPRVPWAVAVIAVAVWLVSRSGASRHSPSNVPGYGHHPLRANAVARPVLLWAWLAGGCAVVALAGYWIILASLVRLPGSVLPNLSGYPWWTASLSVATGAAISPLCEQAGLWGYWQVALEREYSAGIAIAVTAIAFALLPHPPAAAPLLPKCLFFVLTGLTFSVIAFLTNSILPGLAVHVVSLLTFFVFVWPFDPQRSLVADAGIDGWLRLHIAQAVVFSIAALWAFRRLTEVVD